MKQLLLLAFIALHSFQVLAQSEKFQKAMEENIASLAKVSSADQLLDLSNTFERIGDAEKTEWLPYYYAAYSRLMNVFMSSNIEGGIKADIADPAADKAEQLLLKAETLSGENSEIYLVKKLVANLRLMADPMNRYQTYGPIAAEALEKAKQLDPANPRVYLLEGQDKFYTPEQFGGSKTEAKVLFESAIEKFASFKPASSIHPAWGLEQAKYLHEQCK